MACSIPDAPQHSSDPIASIPNAPQHPGDPTASIPKAPHHLVTPWHPHGSQSPNLVLGTVLRDAVELFAELVEAVIDVVHLGTELLVALQVRVELLLVLLAGAV